MQVSEIQPYDSFVGINKEKKEAFYVVLDVPFSDGRHGFNQVILLPVGKTRDHIRRIEPDVFQAWLDQGLIKKFTI